MASLISRWTFDNTYNDNEANANNLSAGGTGNAFSSTTFKVGSFSLDTDGNGYATRTATINGVAGITGNQDRSFGGWFNMSSAGSVQALIKLGSDVANQGHLIIILSGTSIRVDLYTDALSFIVSSLSNNTWHWIWTEYTAATKSSRLYVDNVESSSGSQAHAVNSNLTFGKINIGAGDAEGNIITNSYIDDCRLYSGITSSADRTDIFNAWITSSGLQSKIW